MSLSTVKCRVKHFTKQHAQLGAEYAGHVRGVRNYKKYHAGPFNDVPPNGNSFHRGSRCWHAYERGYFRAWLMTAQEIAFQELDAERRKKP